MTGEKGPGGSTSRKADNPRKRLGRRSRHSVLCRWTLCACKHIAQEHNSNGSCGRCSCRIYTGREALHVEAK